MQTISISEKITARLTGVILIVSLLGANLGAAAPVGAQEASQSGLLPQSPTPTENILPSSPLTASSSSETQQIPTQKTQPTATATPSLLPAFAGPENISSPTPFFLPSPTLAPPETAIQTAGISARIRQAPVLLRNAKRHFRAREKVKLTIRNSYDPDMKLTVVHKSGAHAPVIVSTEKNGDDMTYSLTPLPNFQPGAYTATMTDSQGHTLTQDFTWGVLAINTNKSIYTPHQIANLAIAVLDENGMMVCDAAVTIEITAPSGEKTIRSTDTDTMWVNPHCSRHNFSLEPDYETSYPIGGQIGTYTMDLSATTKKGSYTISDQFTVTETVPFDVERESATRIFPPLTYPMTMRIRANQDFEGTVVETVPAGFTITPKEGVLPYEDIAHHQEQSASGSASTTASPHLRLPFEGMYPISLQFAQIPQSEYVQSQYRKFGAIGHDGADFAVPADTQIRAVDDGEVVAAGPGDYGITVELKHAWGRSWYGHLSTTSATMNQKVSIGDVLGLSGSTGLSTGPHLHFGLERTASDRKNGYFGKINPLPYFGLDPGGFFPTAQSSSMAVKYITWRLNVKKGEEVAIGYNFETPHISPQFYLVGPLRFESASQADVPDSASQGVPLRIQGDAVNNNVIPALAGIQIQFASTDSNNSTESASVEATTGAALSPSAQPITNNESTPSAQRTTIFSEARQWQIAADAAVTIDSAVNTAGGIYSSPAPTLVFISDEVGYTFYNDSNGQCVYNKSLDGGTTWMASPVGLDAQTDCIKIAVWYDRWTPGDDYGYLIHIIITDSSPDDLWYVSLDTRTDTLSTSVAISSSPGPSISNTFVGAGTANYPSITKGRDGDLYAGIHDNPPETSVILKCVSSCTSAANWSDISPTMSADDDTQMWLLPLTNNNIMALVNESATHILEYEIYTDSSGTWSGTWTDVDIDATTNNTYESGGAVAVDRITNNIYVAYTADHSTLGGNDDIRSAVYNGSSFSAKTNVVTNSSCAGVADCGVTGASIGFDEKTGYVYAVYSARSTPATNTTGHVYYKVSTDGMTTWGAEQGPVSANDDDLFGPNATIISTERIYVAWVDDTLDDVIGNTVNTDPLLPYDLRHGAWFNLGRRSGTAF